MKGASREDDKASSTETSRPSVVVTPWRTTTNIRDKVKPLQVNYVVRLFSAAPIAHCINKLVIVSVLFYCFLLLSVTKQFIPYDILR